MKALLINTMSIHAYFISGVNFKPTGQQITVLCIKISRGILNHFLNGLQSFQGEPLKARAAQTTRAKSRI